MVGAVFFFSLGSPLIKFSEAPGPTVALWRLGLAIVAWWVVLLIHRARTGIPLPDRTTWRRVLPAGLFFGANMALFFTVINMTSVAHAEFIAALTPIVLVPIGARFFGEHPNWGALRWGLISVAGVIIVLVGGSGGGASSLTGDSLMLLVMASWIGYLLSTKVARRGPISTVHFMACLVPIAMLSATPIALLVTDGSLVPGTLRAWAVIGVLALISGVGAHGLLVFAQRHLPVATIGIMQVGQPALAALWAWVLLGEDITVVQVPGMILVILGLVAFTLSTQRRSVALGPTGPVAERLDGPPDEPPDGSPADAAPAPVAPPSAISPLADDRR